MATSIIQRAWAAGELSPALSGRADLPIYQTGLKRCNNFIVRREGGVTKRPGTKFIYEVKTSVAASPPRLAKFIFEAMDQTYLLEFGDLYIRFFWHDAVVLSGGVPYEVVTPYVLADVAQLCFAQQADTIVITHPNYAPRKLVRAGHTSWTLSTLTFEPGVQPPTSGLSGTAGAAGAFTFRYQITTVRPLHNEESYASATVTVASCAVPTLAAPNVVNWSAVTGGVEYHIYLDPIGNGLYGFIGASANAILSFRDTGLTPDYTRTPPVAPVNPTPPGTLAALLFSGPGNYPAKCAFHQQRLWMANANNNREHTWGSKIGAYFNFAKSTPLQDDDAVEFVIASKYLSPVDYLVPLKDLLILTDQGEFRVRGGNDGAITPSSISADQETYLGFATNVEPVTHGNGLIYTQARGVKVRDLRFDASVEGLGGRDLTVFASHLFAGYEIVAMEFQLEPWAVLWCVRSDGKLLGCTYLPELEMYAWHQHASVDLGPGCTPGAVIETIAVLPDTANNQDVLYMVVKRTIGGATKRYIERLGKPFYEERTDIEDAFFVDSGLTYDSTPATTFTGLSHLNGERVAILGDGAVVSDGLTGTVYTISGGSVTIPAAKSVVQIGLPITFAEIEKLELDVGGSAIRDAQKIIKSVTAIVYGSDDGFIAGPDRDSLELYQREAWQPSQSWRTGQLEMSLTTDWQKPGAFILQHRLPKPFTLAATIPKYEVGG